MPLTPRLGATTLLTAAALGLSACATTGPGVTLAPPPKAAPPAAAAAETAPAASGAQSERAYFPPAVIMAAPPAAAAPAPAPTVDLGPVYAAPSSAPVIAEAAPALWSAPQADQAPVVAAAPPAVDLGPIAAAPALYAYAAPAETLSAQVLAPAAVYAAPARRLGEMAPVYDEGDQTARRASAFAPRRPDLPPRSGRVYKNADGDLAAPGPWELRQFAASAAAPRKARAPYDSDFAMRLAQAARGQTARRVRYDGSYVKIGYPWGDVPGDMGVCTDVIVRAYRQLGVDLQQLMHEDMRTAFLAYPSWEVYGMSETDTNIDHRRVVNMEAFLERYGESLPPSMNAGDYLPGDIVSWRISGTQPHIGLVSANRDPRSGIPLVIHNIGAGVKEENMLLLSPPVGHYRYTPTSEAGVRTAAL